MHANNRGFSFLIGLLGILLLIRLSVLGILQQITDYVLSWVFAGWEIPFLRTPDLMAASPAAVISDLIVELTILLGTIAILSTKGVWSALMIGGTWTGEFATTILQFLRITTQQRQMLVEPQVQARLTAGDEQTAMILLTLQQQSTQIDVLASYIKTMEKRQQIAADSKPETT